jgi:hypothetical protein
MPLKQIIKCDCRLAALLGLATARRKGNPPIAAADKSRHDRRIVFLVGFQGVGKN